MRDKKDKEEILQILGKVGAVITDRDAIYPHTAETSHLCALIAKQFVNDGVDVVIAMVIDDAILSQWTAYHLTKTSNREVLGVYAEKETIVGSLLLGGGKHYAETGNFIIKRSYDKLIAGKNILVVGNILTTDGSARKVIEAVRVIGGHVVGLGVLCHRGGISPYETANVPKLVSLVDVNLDAQEEATRPLCERNILVNQKHG